MADLLETLSEQRADLPRFGESGMTLSEVLEVAQAEAQQCMQKYVGDFRYDGDQADAVMHRVSSWADKHRAELTEIMKDPSSNELPDKLRLALGVQEMQQFVVALYSEATRTLGPWASGSVPRLVQSGSLDEPEMREDANARLQIFGLIVKWDREGDLRMIFQPEEVMQEMAAGLEGMHPVVIAAIIVGVLIAVAVAAAGIYIALSAGEAVRRSSRLMEELCRAAEKENDQKTVELCLRYSANLQAAAIKQTDWIGDVILALAVVGGLYVVSAHGLPAVAKSLKER